MDICPPFVTNSQTTKTVQPSKCPFHDPTMSSKPFTAFNSFPGDAGCDSTLSQDLTVVPTVIGFVRMQFFRTLSGSTTLYVDGRNGIDHHFQRSRFMDIGRCMPYDERDALPFDHNMALRARFSAICRVGTRRFAPPGAGTLPASNEARVQSSCSASDKCSNSTRCSRSHTPACCQSRNRRQQVIPLPQPISWGSISHGTPVFNTNRIPAKVARLLMRGLPPFSFSSSTGSNGSFACQSPSLTSCFAMPQSYQSLGFC